MCTISLIGLRVLCARLYSVIEEEKEEEEEEDEEVIRMPVSVLLLLNLIGGITSPSGG